MKILNLSLDRKILDINSAVAERMKSYGELVDKYTIIVPAKSDFYLELSFKTDAYGIGVNYGKYVAYLNVLRKASSVLWQGEYNLITTQDPYYLGFLGLYLARKFGLKLEIQVHGFERFFGIKKMIFRRVLRGADSVRVVSERAKREIVDLGIVDEKKIKVLPVPTEVSEFKIDDRSYLNEKNAVLMSAERLTSVKNIFMQINVMAEIVKKHPNIKLKIIGDGALREKLESAVKGRRLENNIEFLGWQKNLKEFYREADIFLLTSSSEGWGLVVVEAAATGLPIVMTDVGCAREFIKNGENGIIVPVGDEEKFTEEVLKLIENPGLRKSLGENARVSADNLMTKEEYLVQLKNNWEQCL